MMKKEFVYKNCNSFPVVVPGKRGIGVMFKPGDEFSDDWFSRFVGKGQLTKIARGQSVVEVMESKLDKSLSDAEVEVLLAKVEKETKHYILKGGIYYCRHCDSFRTGSMIAFKIHMSESHKFDDTLDLEETVVLGPNKSGMPQDTEKEIDVSEDNDVKVIEAIPKTESLLPAVNDVEVDEKEVFTCNVCAKKFQTQETLNQHKEAQHKGTRTVNIGL